MHLFSFGRILFTAESFLVAVDQFGICFIVMQGRRHVCGIDIMPERLLCMCIMRVFCKLVMIVTHHQLQTVKDLIIAWHMIQLFGIVFRCFEISELLQNSLFTLIGIQICHDDRRKGISFCCTFLQLSDHHLFGNAVVVIKHPLFCFTHAFCRCLNSFLRFRNFIQERTPVGCFLLVIVCRIQVVLIQNAGRIPGTVDRCFFKLSKFIETDYGHVFIICVHDLFPFICPYTVCIQCSQGSFFGAL